MATIALVVGGGLAGLVAAACGSAYGEAPRADAGAPTGADADAVTDPCAHAEPPAVPARDDAPDVVLPAFSVALSDGVFDSESAGLDIDGVCTCDARPGTAHAGAESCVRQADTEVQCDQANGVDNGLARLFRSFSAFVDLAEGPRAKIQSGRASILLWIADYNGKANDKDVSVGVLQSDGITEQGCPGSVFDSKTKSWTPAWCGDERWSIRPEAIIGAGITPAVVARGYVSDYTLVVNINGTPRLPFGDGLWIGIAEPTIRAKLVPLGDDLAPRDPAREPTGRESRLWALDDGILVGRIAVRDVLAAIGTSDIGGDGGESYLCQQGAFAVVKDAVCKGMDLPRTRALDFDPAAACDAISAAVQFSGKPALVGDVATGGSASTPCSPGPDGEPLGGGVSYTCP